MPATKVITPKVKGCRFNPNARYMINVETGVVYPYADFMDDLAWMRPYTPIFNIIESEQDEMLSVPAIEGGKVEEEVVVEEVAIDILSKDLTPAQKRKITMANKKKD